MALSASTLGSALYNAVKNKRDPQQVWNAVATEIVNHIKNNAEVDTTIGIAQVVIGAPGAVMNIGTETTTGTVK